MQQRLRAWLQRPCSTDHAYVQALRQRVQLRVLSAASVIGLTTSGGPMADHTLIAYAMGPGH